MAATDTKQIVQCHEIDALPRPSDRFVPRRDA
jgi:hypothetical protein